MGWSKATKLEGRQTKQGLIGLTVENNFAALVEVNCETDFVARNENFRNVVDLFVKSCITHAKQQEGSNPIQKVSLNSEKLQGLQADDGKSLGDHLALMIGNLGENSSIRRGLCIQTNDNIKLYGYAHPAQLEDKPILAGKYGAIVAVKESKPNSIGKNLCQHIVGLNPRKIGVVGIDKPAENIDDETCLIYQEFLSNPEYTVQEVLEENGVEVVDFVRFECGEADSFIGTEVNKIEHIETCQ